MHYTNNTGIYVNPETGNELYFTDGTSTGSYTPIVGTMSEQLHGRRKIVLDYTEVTDENVLKVLCKAVQVHEVNRKEIEYLYNYKKGVQPSLQRIKTVRPEITAHIVENRAAEIVEFRTGYMCGISKAIQYIASCTDEKSDEVTKSVAELNEYMSDAGMSSINKKLFDWVFTCGVGYKIILPQTFISDREHDTPFVSYLSDPRNTFVVYANDLGEKPILGVRYITKENGERVYTCYTENCIYTILRYFEKSKESYRFLQNPEVHYMRYIPIIEYVDNEERMGSFEKVITILDALNTMACDRAEAIEQYVQALLLMHNVKLSEEEFEALREQGCIEFEDITDTKKGEISYISLDLNQTNTQNFVDHALQTVREICGVPSMSDGKTGDSSNNGAVIMRQGWGVAEAHAKNSEEMFKESEKQFIRSALYICDMNSGKLRNLSAKDIEIRFTRRNYEDIQTKAQVFKMLLPDGFTADPKIAFEYSNLFIDPDRDYLRSLEYTNKRKEATATEGDLKPQTSNLQQDGISSTEVANQAYTG